jgi:hypothetical protein
LGCIYRARSCGRFEAICVTIRDAQDVLLY